MTRSLRTLVVLLCSCLLISCGVDRGGASTERAGAQDEAADSAADLAAPTSSFQPSGLSPSAVSRLEEIQAAGVLRVAISNEQSIYEELGDGRVVGVHYGLVLSIADMIGVSAEFTPVEFRRFFLLDGAVPDELATSSSFFYVPDLLQTVDFYAVAMSPLEHRDAFLDFVPMYPSRLVYVSRRDADRVDPNTFADAVFAVIPNTTYAAWFEEQFHGAGIEALAVETGIDLLEAVNDGRAAGTVADANLVLAQLDRFPDLEMYPAGGPIETLSWATRDNDPIAELLAAYLDVLRERSVFAGIWHEYYDSRLIDYLSMLSES